MQHFTQIFRAFLGLVILAYCHVEGTTSPSASPQRLRNGGTSPPRPANNGGGGGGWRAKWTSLGNKLGSMKPSNYGSFRSNSGQYQVVGSKSFQRTGSWQRMPNQEKQIKTVENKILELFTTSPSGQAMFENLEAYQNFKTADGYPVETMEQFFSRFMYTTSKGPQTSGWWDQQHYCTAVCMNLYGYLHQHNQDENQMTREQLYKTVLIPVTEPKLARSVAARVFSVFGNSAANTYKCGCNTSPKFIQMLIDNNLNINEFQTKKNTESPEAALEWLGTQVEGSKVLMTVTFEMYRGYIIDSLKGLADGSAEALKAAFEGLRTPGSRQKSFNAEDA